MRVGGGGTAACRAATHLLTARLRAARGREATGGGEKRKLRRAPPGARGARGRAARRGGALRWNRHPPPPPAPGSDLQIAGIARPLPLSHRRGVRRAPPVHPAPGGAWSRGFARSPALSSFPPHLPSGRAGPVSAERRGKPEAGRGRGVGRRPVRGPRPGGGVM